MHGEHDETTRELIRGAVAELAAVGQAEFTMDGVVRRSYYSPGALYERWSDRGDLISAAGTLAIIPDVVEGLARVIDAGSALEWVLDDGRDRIALVGEVMLAGSTTDAVRPVSLQAWQALHEGLGRHLPPGMAWFMAVYSLGNALLDVIGLHGPMPARGRIPWLREACDVELEERRVMSQGRAADDIDVPQVPLPARSDATAQALIQAAQTLLHERGAEALSTRRVSAAAGVTTGALYRRYRGKADLLADVLHVELAPDRYEWTWDLVGALAEQNPYWASADVMTGQFLAAAQDTVSQRVLLQIGVAARNDPVLRGQVQQRVAQAHRARRELFATFIKEGVMRSDVDPAVFAWGFQTLPVGARVLLALDIPLDGPAVATAMRAILTAAASAGAPSAYRPAGSSWS